MELYKVYGNSIFNNNEDMLTYCLTKDDARKYANKLMNITYNKYKDYTLSDIDFIICKSRWKEMFKDLIVVKNNFIRYQGSTGEIRFRLFYNIANEEALYKKSYSIIIKKIKFGGTNMNKFERDVVGKVVSLKSIHAIKDDKHKKEVIFSDGKSSYVWVTRSNVNPILNLRLDSKVKINYNVIKHLESLNYYSVDKVFLDEVIDITN